MHRICLVSFLLGRIIVGEVTLKQIFEIASIKKQDAAFKNMSLQGVCKCIIHSCHSVGVRVVNDRTTPLESENVALPEANVTWYL